MFNIRLLDDFYTQTLFRCQSVEEASLQIAELLLDGRFVHFPAGSKKIAQRVAERVNTSLLTLKQRVEIQTAANMPE